MNYRLSILFAAVVSAFSPLAGALYFDVPEFYVEGSGDFFIRKLNAKAEVEIRRANDLGLDWKVSVPESSVISSEFRLTSDGRHLVHIRGNDMVNSLDDVCVEVFQKSGEHHEYLVKELMDELPEYEGDL